jgi:hypothetical protein
LKRATIAEIVGAVFPLMRGFEAHWCVAGGWALDLFLGHVTRSHEDLELAIFRPDQERLRQHLRGWRFQKVVEGRLMDWPAVEELTLSIHEIHAQSTKDPDLSLEFLLNERIGEDWTYRRDPCVRLSLSRAIVRGIGGLPLLCPAIVLLFKAKNPRPKDDQDFQQAREALNRQQVRWLEASLRICHPDHPWLTQLHMMSGIPAQFRRRTR